QGLYRPAHAMNGSILPDGSVRNLSRSAFLVWEFPVLFKYRKLSRLAPSIEVGPSFRAIGHPNSKNYSHRGITAGLGVSARALRLNVAPTIRYTRWGADKMALGFGPIPGTQRDQVELVFGFTF